MDIESMKKLLNRKIEVGKKVNKFREVIKDYNKEKRDMYDYTEKLFKPTIKAQKEVKETIDKKQNELIDQLAISDAVSNMKQNEVISKLQQNNAKQNEIITNLQENQNALKKGFYDLIEPYQREIILRDELPKMIEDKGSDKEKESPYKSDLDKGFKSDEIQILINYDLVPPSDVLKLYLKKEIDVDNYERNVGKFIQELGRQKGVLSNTKKRKAKKNEETDELSKELDELSKEINVLQRYKKRIGLIEEGSETLGEGIYTQKERNAYNISKRGQYGGLVIDLPKLYGHLKVVAHKNGQKKCMINRLTLTHLIF